VTPMTHSAPSESTRADAQDWFTQQHARQVSAGHDERETAATAELSAAFLISRYEALHGSPPGSLLDIGCGDARLLARIAAGNPSISLTGTDTVAAAVAQARRTLPGARILQQEGAPAGPFDAILIHLNLGLWSQPSSLLAYAVRQLSPVGLMYIVDINADDIELGLSHAINDDERAYLTSQYASAYTLREFTSLLDKAAPTRHGFDKVAGTSTFAGFGYDSRDYLRMMTAPRVIAALRRQQRPSSSRLPALLHGWVSRISCGSVPQDQ
jgi:SAM-dependent methyltransferase